MSNLTKNLILWLVIAMVLMAVFNNFAPQNSRTEREVDYSMFLGEVKQGRIEQVTIQGREIHARTYGGDRIVSYSPGDPDLVNDLLKAGVAIRAAKEDGPSLLMQIFISWCPLLLLIGGGVFFMRQMQGGGGRGALSFGKSKARLLTEDKNNITFADVAGVDEAKEEVQELVEFLSDPSRFQKLGGRIPRGVLMTGSPGTGKTLLAKAIAGEAKVPFFTISGSDFVEMFVGVGASRVRDMFDQGKKNAPCIIFIDEIDAVGRQRGAGLGGGHDEREQTLNQLLVEMDGFDGNEGVIVIAATNRPDVLDPALLRPGRFDRRIVVNRPDDKGREGIFGVHTRKVPLADAVDLHVQDFEFAKDKVMMGSERRSLVISDEEKQVTAIHEAGHALLGAVLEHADPVHKVTIIPRGRALGVTQQLPVDDKLNYSTLYLHDQVAVLLGGRIAEQLTNTAVTTGAGNDLDRVTDLARKMVCEWGMSETIGPLTFGRKEEQIFLGRDFAQQQEYSEETASAIDQEMKRIVTENYDRARAILEEKKTARLQSAEELLPREVRTGAQVTRIISGLPLEEPLEEPLEAAPVVASDQPTSSETERPPVVPSLGKPLPQE